MGIYSIPKSANIIDFIIESEKTFDDILASVTEDSTALMVINNPDKGEKVSSDKASRFKTFINKIKEWFKKILDRALEILKKLKEKLAEWGQKIKEKFQFLLFVGTGETVISYEGFKFTPHKVPIFDIDDAESIVEREYKVKIENVLGRIDDTTNKELDKAKDADVEEVKREIRKASTGISGISDSGQLYNEIYKLYRNGKEEKQKITTTYSVSDVKMLINDLNDSAYDKKYADLLNKRAETMKSEINKLDKLLTDAEKSFTVINNEEYTLFNKNYSKYLGIINSFREGFVAELAHIHNKYRYIIDNREQNMSICSYLLKIGILKMPKAKNASYLGQFLDRVVID